MTDLNNEAKCREQLPPRAQSPEERARRAGGDDPGEYGVTKQEEPASKKTESGFIYHEEPVGDLRTPEGA